MNQPPGSAYTSVNLENAAFVALNGTRWTLAPDNAEAKEVIAAYKWGANSMVVAGGAAYYTPQGSSSSAGGRYTTGYLQTSGTTYKTGSPAVST